MRLIPIKKIVSPFWRWALFLVLLPTLELFFMLAILKWWLLIPLSMLLCGLLGVFIAQRAGRYHWEELNRQLDHGETPTVPVLHVGLILLGVLLMVLPGILTSLLGLFLLFPLARSFVVSYLVLQFEAQRLRTQHGSAVRSPEIIDV